MAMEEKTYTVHVDGFDGEVQIADEVITIIAGLAATEVEGVSAMTGNITNELVARLGMKNLSKGVKIIMGEDSMRVHLALNIDYGYSIPEVCKNVQDRVKSTIETMTGLTVSEVNIRIADVNLENDK